VPEQEERAAEDEARPDLRPADAVALPVAARQRPGEEERPAVTWRKPIARSGGTSRTAIVTAMKVEPQTT
jgi:hypothetical protein